MPLNTFRNEDYSVASKDHALVYPLSVDKRPPETTFVNIFGTKSNKKHVNDFHFYGIVFSTAPLML